MCLWGVAAGGETEEEKIRVDVLENQTRDTADDLASLCYSSDFVSPSLGRAGQGLKGDQGILLSQVLL